MKQCSYLDRIPQDKDQSNSLNTVTPQTGYEADTDYSFTNSATFGTNIYRR